MTKLYVVEVNEGEYSSRTNWIGGVFTDREIAERYVVERSAAARQHEIDSRSWHKLRSEAWNAKFPQPQPKPTMPGYPSFTPPAPSLQDWPAFAEQYGREHPMPTWEGGEWFKLIEVELNQWGHWEGT